MRSKDKHHLQQLEWIYTYLDYPALALIRVTATMKRKKNADGRHPVVVVANRQSLTSQAVELCS